MSRGYRRFASLLLSACCILSMLFLDICEVKAGSTDWINFNLDTTFYPNVSKDHTYGTISGGGGSIYQGTGSIIANTGSSTTYSNLGYSYHVRIPIIFRSPWNKISSKSTTRLNANTYFKIYPYLRFNSSTGTVSNLSMYYNDRLVIAPNSASNEAIGLTIKGNDISIATSTDDPDFFAIPFVIEYDIAFRTSEGASEQISEFHSIMNFDIQVYGRVATSSEIASGQISVQDNGTQQELSTLNDSTEKIEESVTSDTGGGILATIKNFFGSFFENVINSFKSLFIPEDGYFTDWFNRLNNLLAKKLGMLYAPFDLLITTLQAIYDAESSEQGIPFPGIKWNDVWLVEPTIFNFDSLGDSEGITKLRDTVYFGTDTVLLFAFLYLLQSKVRHILEG